MAYIHEVAEKDWKAYIKKKTKDLKEAGCPEEWIKTVIKLERADFNKERSFLEHEDITAEGYFINYPVFTDQPIETVDDIFDHIADPELFAYLKKADNVMLNIILLQVQDYEIKEIAEELKLTKNAVYKRIRIFRKNLPKKG